MASIVHIIQQHFWALPLLGVLLFAFRPLLVGVARAALLVVRPRLTQDERRAREQLRDMRIVQRMINSSSGPSDAAELRAIAARA